MSSKSPLGDAVLLTGAELYFNLATTRPDDSGVKRLVPIRLGMRNIVFHAARNGLPAMVDNTECLIALAYIVEHDAHTMKIMETVNADHAIYELALDGPKVLSSSRDVEGGNLVRFKLCANISDCCVE